MRRSIFAIAVAFVLAATPVFSAHGSPKPGPTSSGTSAQGAKPTTTTKVKPVAAKSTTKAPKAPKSSVKPAKSTSTKPVSSATTKSAKATVTSETKTAKSTAKAETKAAAKTADADAKAAKKTTATTTATSTNGDATAPGTGETVTLTPVQEKLQRNTNLASKLERKLDGRLPAGTDLMDAALGFKNLGQFVAAVNVSTNLQLDFMELKARIVDQKMSLGQAIQDLKTTASPTVEAQRAEYDARVMIAASEAETSTTATTNASNDTTTKTKQPKKSNKKGVGGAE